MPVQAPGLLRFPAKLVADVARSRLYVADTGNNRVLGIRLDDPDSAGTIDLIVGGETQGLRDGPPAAALFGRPNGLALSDDMLYVADTENHTIRAIELPSGQVTSVAGTGDQSHDWRSPAPPGRPVHETQAITTPLNSPWDVCVRGSSLFLAMAGFHQIWRLDLTSGLISPWSGSGAEAVEDGPPHEAALAQPSSLALQDDRLYFADPESSAIRWADLDDAVVHTIVGTGLFDFGDRDGIGDKVRLQHPLAIIGHGQMVFIADTYNNKIKQLDVARREVTTWLDESAGLNEPSGLALTPTHLYIADTNNHRIVIARRDGSDVSILSISQ
jgi:sugar lactone lactonase YvrE